jgi:glycerol-3-phosphate acyltransferase PlsX
MTTTDAPVISVDAMGGDHGPAVVVAGVAKALAKAPELRFVIHGPEATLAPLISRRRELAGSVELRDAPRVVEMADKPSQALRTADGTSMWSTLGSVASGEARVAVSCGNTGALMAMSMLRLRKAPGVDRPAIAVVWPSRSATGHNIVLDVGADVRGDPRALAQFALMGAEYARLSLGLSRPRLGLLNVGSEETKGRAELREALALVAGVEAVGGFELVGFVEGGDLCGDRADVIVTDGFTGNIALKSAEGAAAFIGAEMRKSFNRNLLTRLAGLIALPVFARLKRRIDPRRVNGGVFLGLGGAVVKSHGSADATGVAAAVALAARMATTGFAERVAAQAARLAPATMGESAR